MLRPADGGGGGGQYVAELGPLRPLTSNIGRNDKDIVFFGFT